MATTDLASNAPTTSFVGRLQQVTMTIVTRKWLFLLYLGGMLLGALSLFGPQVSDYELGMSGWSLGYIILCKTSGQFSFIALIFASVLLIGSQGKHWFVRPEARLTPGYCRPHLVFHSIALFAHFFALPFFVIGPYLEIDSLGLAACTACVVGLGLMMTKNMLFMIPSMLIGLSAYVPLINRFWCDSALPYEPYRAIFLIAGWGGIISWLWQQATLSEESDDYSMPIFDQTKLTATHQGISTQNKLIAKRLNDFSLFAKLSDAMMDRFLSKPSHQLNHLISKSFLAAPFPAVVNQALAMMILFTAIVFFTKQFFPSNAELSWGMTMQPIIFAFIMPGMMNQAMWTTKKPFMESELLRPYSRQEYIRSLFIYTLKQTSYALPIYLIGVLAMVAMSKPELLTLLNVVLFSFTVLASNLLATSFSLFGACYKSKFVGMLIAVLPLLLGFLLFIPIVVRESSKISEPFQVGLTQPAFITAIILTNIALLLVSTGMTYAAYRKWMRTELG